MTTPMRRPEEPPPEPSGPVRYIEPGPLWAGGVATAIVAALIALVGILVSRWLFTIPHPGDAPGRRVGRRIHRRVRAVPAGAALVATAIMHLLLLTTPRPQVFFGWIIGLATIIAVVFPFSTTAPVDQKAATALVNLILGIAIWTLTLTWPGRAVRRRRARRQLPVQPAAASEAGQPVPLSASCAAPMVRVLRTSSVLLDISIMLGIVCTIKLIEGDHRHG